MTSTLNKSCSLVRFKNLNGKTQYILEIALKYEVIPFSCKDSKNSFIFESSSQEVLNLFHNELIEVGFEMEIKMFYR